MHCASSPARSERFYDATNQELNLQKKLTFFRMKKKSTEDFLFHETNYNTSLPALQTLSKQVRSTVLFFLRNLTSVNLEAATP